MSTQEKLAIGNRLCLRISFQRIISIFYFALLIFSFSLTVRWMIIWTSYDPKCIVWRAVTLAVMGNTLYYLRKLYKNMINYNFITEAESSFCHTREFGTLLYYLLRPVFAASLAIVFYFLVEAQIIFIVDSLPKDQTKFGLFVITFSFFIGFSTGRMLEKMLAFSTKQIDKLQEHIK
jgi:hypothetical protein